MLITPAKHVSKEINERYETGEWKHASALLVTEFVEEWKELKDILLNFRFTKSQVFMPGGSMSTIAHSIHTMFKEKGWEEKKFAVTVLIDSIERSSETHKVDHYKQGIAVETEWNSKDSVFDRDLKNFRLLYDMDIISMGVVITRSDSLQDLFDSFGYDLGKKYGASTTNMTKLREEVMAGTCGGCPLLIFGITEESYVEDEVPQEYIDALLQSQSQRRQKDDEKRKKKELEKQKKRASSL